MFKDWKTPTDKDFEKMIEHDIENWNIPRFVKDQKRLSAVYKVFQKHIKQLFYILVSC